MRRLEIGTVDGKPLTLPAAEAATQTIVVYGGKGMGKTNLAAVLMEELAAAGQRFATIDPVGVSWGVRHSADGKGEGLKLVILGGRHGDLPIEPTGGAVVADFVVDEQENVLIDISARADGRRWSQGEKIRFVADYLTRLMERQGERRRPLMQIIDEAARFAPQVIPHGAVDMARCLGALEVLVEEGRNVGVGITLITQRSARMAKSVSELAELMIAFRTIGPNSVEAIADWLGEHVEKTRWKEIIGQVRSLPRGSALVVSPGWLELEGVVEIRLRETFDSSKTPTGTEKALAGRARPVDLEKYRERMLETVAKAEAADPRKLREKTESAERAYAKVVAELEKVREQLAATKGKAAPAPKEATLRKSDREDLERITAATHAAKDRLAKAGALFQELLDKANKDLAAAFAYPDYARLLAVLQAPPAIAAPAPLRAAAADVGRPMPTYANPARTGPTRLDTAKPVQTRAIDPSTTEWGADARLVNAAGELNKPTRAFLTALAQYGRPLSRAVLLSASAYKPSGDTQKAMAAMRDHGLVTESGAGFAITAKGRAALGDYEPLPTGAELLAHLVDGSSSSLSSAERKLMRALYDAKQHPISREVWLERAGMRPSGDTQKAMAKFLRLEWAVERDGGYVAADTFYGGGS